MLDPKACAAGAPLNLAERGGKAPGGSAGPRGLSAARPKQRPSLAEKRDDATTMPARAANEERQRLRPHMHFWIWCKQNMAKLWPRFNGYYQMLIQIS